MRRVGNWSLFCAVLGTAAAGLAAAAPPDVRLVDAAARQDTAAVRALLAAGADANTPRADGATALLWAAHWDDHEAAGLLLAAGADPNAADDDGVVPLVRASENASLRMVEALLAAGADAGAAQTSGLTPLMVAARTGSTEVVRALLAHGADVDAATVETAATALMWAVAAPHRGIVAELLAAGADVEASSSKGMTPLLTAAYTGDVATAELLIAGGRRRERPGLRRRARAPVGHRQGPRRLRPVPAGARRRPERDPRRGARTARGRRGDVRPPGRGTGTGGTAPRASPSRRSFRGPRPSPSSAGCRWWKALLAHGADPNGRITTSTLLMTYIGHPTKGRVRAIRLRHRRPARRHVVVGGGLRQRQRRGLRPSTARGGIRPPESSAAIIRALLAAGADPHLTTDDGTDAAHGRRRGLGRPTFRPQLVRGARSRGAEEAVRDAGRGPAPTYTR